MRALRSHIATLLLLCFVRVLLPESAILALHRHAHTEHEQSAAGPVSGGQDRAKALLSAKHQHCPVDHLFDVPFQPAPELTLAPVVHTFAPLPRVTVQSVWSGTAPATADLRGPPALV